LYDAGVPLILGTDMPSLHKTTLADEYLAAVEHAGLTLDELQEVALNAVRYSLQAPGTKQAMLQEFSQEYDRLRAEHLQTT
jgi:adenosine deaminase